MNVQRPILTAAAAAATVMLMLAGGGCGGAKVAGPVAKNPACESGVCLPGSKGAGHEHATRPAEPAEMNTAALVVLMRSGVKMRLLEARPGVKDLIPGARLVPVTAGDAQVRGMLPERDALYVTYCGSAKCSASVKLAAKLRGLGYPNVIEFRQGWAGWSRHVAGKELGEPEINAAALHVLMNSGADPEVIDARTGKYDDGRRVPGAGSLSAASDAETVAAAIGSKDRLVVTYCTNLKCPASRMLAAHLGKLGYRNVLEYPQGIEGWAAAGYPVEKAR